MADNPQLPMPPPLWHQSGVNPSGKPFVQLILGEQIIAQMDVGDARDHAAAMLEAAEAAEQDAFILQFFQREFDMTFIDAMQILLRFRAVRAELTEKRGGPTRARDWVMPPPKEHGQ